MEDDNKEFFYRTTVFRYETKDDKEFFYRTTITRYDTNNEFYIRYPDGKWSVQIEKGELSPIEKLVYITKEDEKEISSRKIKGKLEKITKEDLERIDEKSRDSEEKGGRLVGFVSYRGIEEFYISNVVRRIERITPGKRED